MGSVGNVYVNVRSVGNTNQNVHGHRRRVRLGHAVHKYAGSDGDAIV